MKRLTSEQLPQAAELLKAGELVAFPTETVYGLGACIFDSNAVQSIFKAKGRPSDNPLIAHVSDLEQIFQIAQEIPDVFFRLAERFFPGPLTVVLKRRPEVPAIVSAGLQTIAVRMPSHPIAHKLISLVGQPLVAPSANLSGRPSATQAGHVLEDLHGRIAAVVDGGKTQLGIESTVISLLNDTPRLLRPGSIAKEEIEQFLKCNLDTAKTDGPVLSPGMKYRHYCPRAPIRLFNSKEELEAYLAVAKESSRMLLARPYMPTAFADSHLLAAEEFYSLLRLADEKNTSEILILCDADLQQDAALMNRLLRAAGCF